MPSTALSSTSLTRNVTDGVNLAAALTAVDGTNGNNFQNDGTTLLRVKNGAGASITATVKFSAQSVDGATLVNPLGKVYTIPATTGDRLLGPFPVVTYGTTVEVVFSSGTSVTAAVYQPGN